MLDHSFFGHFFYIFLITLFKYLFLTLKEPDKSFVGIAITRILGSTPAEVPPHIIEMEAVGAIAVLLENLSL